MKYRQRKRSRGVQRHDVLRHNTVIWDPYPVEEVRRGGGGGGGGDEGEEGGGGDVGWRGGVLENSKHVHGFMRVHAGETFLWQPCMGHCAQITHR